MEIFSDIVRNVVLIVLLTVFLQMLVPREAIGRYVKFVMGLFVMVAILNPLLPILTGEEIIEISAWQLVPPEQQVNTVLESGERLRQKNDQLALEQYEQSITKQLESMVGLVNGVGRAEAEVLLLSESGEIKLGMIEEVTVIIYPEPVVQQETEEILVEPVQINGNEQKKKLTQQETERMIREVEQGLMAVYNLTPEQINIIVSGE